MEAALTGKGPNRQSKLTREERIVRHYASKPLSVVKRIVRNRTRKSAALAD